jgi:hypothetical protein
MPFTVSHPAAVIPLKLLFKRLSLPALIFGSMAPDFEYFFRMKSRYSHTLIGAFWFDLPLTLALLFIFFTLICEPLVSSLPSPLRARFANILNINWTERLRKDWFLISCSAVLGSLTHILWDGFTHYNGYFVERSTFLSAHITDSFPVYRALQHLSTILGGLFICFVIYKLPKKEVSGKARVSFWVLTAALTAAVFPLLYFCVWEKFNDFWHIVIIFLSSLFSAVIISSIAFKLRKVFFIDFST